MHKNFTRREFLKTTSAAMLAAVAASALSACSGNDNSSSDIDLARTLGNLTFNVIDFNYPAGYSSQTINGKSEEEYWQSYSPILSVKNNGTSPVSMGDVKFEMALEGADAPTYTTDKDCLFSENKDTVELKSLAIEPASTRAGYLGYVRKTETEEENLRIAHLTITYDKKKVTYTFDGKKFSASGVTNI